MRKNNSEATKRAFRIHCACGISVICLTFREKGMTFLVVSLLNQRLVSPVERENYMILLTVSRLLQEDSLAILPNGLSCVVDEQQ